MHAGRKESTKASGCGSPLPWRLINVTQGDCMLADNPGDALTTVLGSCISACVRDPVSGLGGMNHFLLPSDTRTGEAFNMSLRYGVNAMEALMNTVTSRSGIERRRLEIKVFGGADVHAALGPVGSRNADFIERFIEREGLKLAAKHLRGTRPRKIVYHPASGKVLMRYAHDVDEARFADEERRLARRVAARQARDDVELFR